MSDLQLLNDYFWILEQCPDPDEAFKDKQTEKNLASEWLLKLSTEIYYRKEDKQLRNLYLLELSKCIKQGELTNIFRSMPPKGKLQPLESILKIQFNPKVVISEMQATAAELVPHVSPRNYETHMATKIFDDNHGACAYLAVSLGEPKEGPIWLEMGSKEPFFQTNIKTEKNENLECGDPCENEEVNVEFLELCLQETAKQLAGQAEPGECPMLEEQLALYENFIKNYDVGNESRNLNKSELRTFLLVNFQTDLLHALQRQQ